MAEKSTSLENQWTFGPEVPTSDLFEHRDVRNESDREWLVNDLIYDLGRGDFLRWEAVVRQELGLPLLERQRHTVDGLLTLSNEPDEERNHYINGIAGTCQLWYEIVRTIASHLPLYHFRTDAMHYGVTTHGWKDLVAALEKIQWFVRDLREHRDSIEFLDLTLETLVKLLILPPQEEPIFVEMMKRELGLNSMKNKIAERLS
jgi:hypothetical protein